MKLTIRPLGAGQRGKDVFVVEAEPSQTIRDLKLRISEQGFPVETQNILSTGKSLQDDKTIASYAIKDASTLVLMIKASSASSAAVTPSASKNNSPRIAPGTLSTQPTVPAAGTTSANRLTVPSTGYAAPPAPPVASSSSIGISETAPGLGLNGTGISSNVGPSQSNIDQIVGMGFTQAQAVRALRASFDNLDQALDLLLNDPNNLGASGATQAPTSMGNGLLNGFLGNPSGSANGTAPQPSSSLPQSLIPQNLMNMVAQQQQQQELPDLSSMSLGALGGLGGGAAGGATGGASSGAPTAEVTAEQIEEIRRMVALNPILTGPLLEQIKEEDIDLYNYIDNDPEKLLLALGRGPDDTGSGGPPVPTAPTSMPPAAARAPNFAPVPAPVPQGVPPGAQTTTISVTQEEHAQIEGIVGMGFDRQTVLQAYLACDRNAERAIEFLLAGAFE